jgi:hypothetical protein
MRFPPLEALILCDSLMDIHANITSNKVALNWHYAVIISQLAYSEFDILFWPTCRKEVDIPLLRV